MKCLLISDGSSDFSTVLRGCGADITRLSFDDAMDADLPEFDAFVICSGYGVLDPRLRLSLENQVQKGKRIFTEALGSFGGIYSDIPADTTRNRLVVCPDSEIPGLDAGDLLDDMSNRSMRPWYNIPDMKTLLVYREHITAHRHIDADKAFYSDGVPALFTVGDNIMMCTFEISNFNLARFAPRKTRRHYHLSRQQTMPLLRRKQLEFYQNRPYRQRRRKGAVKGFGDGDITASFSLEWSE